MTDSRVVLFANGEIEDPQAVGALLQPGDTLVAVDGGLRYLLRIGRVPDVLIGDLDSISADELEAARSGGARILRYPVEKDDTDLELALKLALEQGSRVVRIFGALGGRPDQQMANIFMLTSPALADVDVRIVQPGLEIFLIRSRMEIFGHKGDTLSLQPLLGPAVGVTTEGLYYPLHHDTLLPYRTRGISNVMLGERAEVSLDEGVLLCVHEKLKKVQGE